MVILLRSKTKFQKPLIVTNLKIPLYQYSDFVENLFDKKDDRITIISQTYKNYPSINVTRHYCQASFSFSFNTIEQKDIFSKITDYRAKRYFFKNN